MLFSALYGRRKSKDQHLDDIPEYTEGQLERFSLRQLQVATDTFSAKNLLGRGRGGSGKVYKGQLVNGTLVAVRRLNMVQTTGKEIQFQTEVQMFSIMAVHRNILRLRGFCTTTKERLLVYPYMAKGSVASCLRERPQNVPPLDWGTRKRIALGIARGLSFLHEHCDPKIIHRDVKAANIFLDEEYEAVVRDFSLAKLMVHNDTHETTAVRGTVGHIAPEYLSTGKMSEKTDVFAYGVTLLELITAQRAFDLARLANDEDVMLLDWVKGLLKEKKLETVVDPDLHTNYVDEDVEQLIQVALLCTQTSELGRPKMSEVVRLLEGDGLAEKWDEWQKVEMTQQEVELGSAIFGKLERFSLHQLRVATDMFGDKNLLERGRFGKVYKGQLIDGTLVAIKRLTEEWGPPGEFQFVVHVEMISKAVHHNLLSLRGFCMTPTEWLLVYPYMVNGNVASCLRARPPNLPPLDWWTRKRIALGCARGLSYLHDHCDPKIIHGDVKAANIFLDEDFEAIVGDIGLYKPKLMDHEVTDIGHLAPEYLTTGKTSEKTDVFAYGVSLLELLTGQRVFDLARLANTHDAMLLDSVKGLLKGKKLAMLVDPVLHSNYVEEEVEQLIEVALLCTQTSALRRPMMSEVVRLFEGDGLAEKWDEWQKVEEVELASRPTFD